MLRTGQRNRIRSATASGGLSSRLPVGTQAGLGVVGQVSGAQGLSYRRMVQFLRLAGGQPGEDKPVEDPEVKMRRLEAVLFIARDPLTSRKAAELADLEDGTETRTLIRQLNRNYDRVGRAFRIERIAGGYQLLTRPGFANWLRKLSHVPPELRLSAPAFETLSVIAYRQPVMRSEIEAIRGVNCGEILKQLMERDLVRISGRAEELGKPYLYSTTKLFLKSFGLNNLDALPRAERMRQSFEPEEELSQTDDAADASEASTGMDES